MKTGKIKCIGFLVMIMMFAVFCGITNNMSMVHAEVYGNFKYSLINGGTEVEITWYNGSDTELVIPSEIDGKAVTSIGYGAFDNCSSLTSVEIPDGVTYIGGRAFSFCSNLISIEIPSNVRSIGYSAFSRTPWLTNKQEENPMVIVNHIVVDGEKCEGNVIIPDGIIGIAGDAFRGNSSLTNIKLPDGVMNIGNNAFEACSSLASIEIPSSVTSIDPAAFAGCSSLTSVKIPDGVTSISNATFNSCSSLTTIEIPDGVTSIEDVAFGACSNLTSIKIPASVTSIGTWAFSGTPWLTNKQKENSIVIVNGIVIDGEVCEGNITIPDGVRSIGDGAFTNCNNLTSIEIPSSVASIGDGAFRGCSSLTSIEIPSSVTSIGDGAFADCNNLTSIEIPSSVASIGDGAFRDCSSLISVEIPSGVASIGDDAFSGCSSLTSVEIPSSVVSIGDWAFDEDITLIVTPSSYAETYAKENNIPYTYSGEKWTVTIKNSNGQVVRTLCVDKGGILSAPQPSEERTNETFLGFYNGDTKFDFSKPITDNVTLTEKWEEKKENPEKPVTPPQESRIILSKEVLFFDTIGVMQVLTATVTPDTADKKVTWTSSDEKVAIVTDGVVTSVGNGMAVITVKSEDGKTATATVTVSQKTMKLSIQLKGQSVSGTLKAKVKKSYCFKAVVTPSNADAKNAALTWTSSNKKIATVTNKGKVTIKKAGKVTITAKTADGRKTTIKLNATKKAVKVTKLKITGSKTMKVKAKQTLILKLLPATADNQKVTWKSSNKKIATVNSKGVVTAKKAGKVTITATAKDGSRKKATIKITVKK